MQACLNGVYSQESMQKIAPWMWWGGGTTVHLRHDLIFLSRYQSVFSPSLPLFQCCLLFCPFLHNFFFIFNHCFFSLLWHPYSTQQEQSINQSKTRSYSLWSSLGSHRDFGGGLLIGGGELASPPLICTEATLAIAAQLNPNLDVLSSFLQAPSFLSSSRQFKYSQWSNISLLTYRTENCIHLN